MDRIAYVIRYKDDDSPIDPRLKETLVSLYRRFIEAFRNLVNDRKVGHHLDRNKCLISYT